MNLVVAYDITENRRRERLRKALRHFGNPVQKSVFECDLSPRQIEKMTRVINSIIDRTEDNVRYYQICKACTRSVKTFGGREFEKRLQAYII